MRPLITFPVLALLFATPANAQRAPDLGWNTFVDREWGTTVDVPTGLFTEEAGGPPKGSGAQFKTSDNRALIRIYTFPNEERDTPASFIKKNSKMSVNAMDYSRITSSFFAISAVDDGTIYYSRCNFSARGGGALHCFDMAYPEHEEKAWDAIVTRISRSLRPLHSGGG